MEYLNMPYKEIRNKQIITLDYYYILLYSFNTEITYHTLLHVLYKIYIKHKFRKPRN